MIHHIDVRDRTGAEHDASSSGCSRSFAEALAEWLLDAGAEFG